MIIKNGEVFHSEEKVAWECMECGHLHYGNDAPGKCPVCGADKAKFKYVLFKAFLFGTPNDIFDTPNIVFTPNFSFTILMHFKVSNASSC